MSSQTLFAISDALQGFAFGVEADPPAGWVGRIEELVEQGEDLLELMIRIRKTDPESLLPQPQNRRMSPAAALQLMHDVQIGDILLETTENRKLRLRRVARPNGKQAELLNTLSLSLPERLCADRDITDEASLAIAQSNPSQMQCRLFAQIIAGTPAPPDSILGLRNLG